MNGRWAAIAAISGLISVGAGAFGAHALEGRLEPRALETWDLAARYQMYHALAMLFAAVMIAHRRTKLAPASAAAFLAGTIIFSGSLYALALTGIRLLGAITPIGGVAMMAGWLLLALAALKPQALEADGT